MKDEPFTRRFVPARCLTQSLLCTKSRAEMESAMNYRLLADTALLAGEIMLQSGAETYRVEETITRILKTSGQERTEAIAYVTGIMITLDGKDTDAITLIKRIGERDNNLGYVYEVNNISRDLCSDKIKLEEAYERLKNIKEKKMYKDWVIAICIIATSASFTILLGGGIYDCLFAAVNGMFLVILSYINKKLKMKRFVLYMLTSLCMALVSVLLTGATSLPINQEILIAGSIMAMLPGVALTNAIRDTLQGDYMSGTARGIEAFVIALALAVGIGAGLYLGPIIFHI